MKIQPRGIEAFVKKPPPETLAVLLYGPDEGLVRERLNTLTKNVTGGGDDPFAVVDITGGQLQETPSRALDEAQSFSMLGGRRVVRVRGADDKSAPMLKDLLAAVRDGDNLVLVEAGELTPRSALRILFENADNAAAIPCYVEDERDIARVLQDGLKAAGFSIPSDALVYMAANVVGDRAVARGEVEKLVTYMGGNKSITLDDIIACVGSSAALSLDDLAKHVASGQFAEAERILLFVLSEGTAAVSVLRTLQNYFTRLYLTRARLARGENMEAALAKLRPPLFFKVKPAFSAQVTAWTPQMLEQALSILTGAEAKCKQTGMDPAIICSRAILTLSQMAARALSTRRRA